MTDLCPSCLGVLLNIDTLRARCMECGDIWQWGDDLRWRRERIPVRYKMLLASLPVLLWIAGHAETLG